MAVSGSSFHSYRTTHFFFSFWTMHFWSHTYTSRTVKFGSVLVSWIYFSLRELDFRVWDFLLFVLKYVFSLLFYFSIYNAIAQDIRVTWKEVLIYSCKTIITADLASAHRILSSKNYLFVLLLLYSHLLLLFGSGLHLLMTGI